MVLFIFFECLPVFVKLMSARDAYDSAIQNRQAVDFHRSSKDRDAEMAAINQTHDHHIQALTNHQIDTYSSHIH